jgi:hypothetical protein
MLRAKACEVSGATGLPRPVVPCPKRALATKYFLSATGFKVGEQRRPDCGVAHLSADVVSAL